MLKALPLFGSSRDATWARRLAYSGTCRAMIRGPFGAAAALRMGREIIAFAGGHSARVLPFAGRLVARHTPAEFDAPERKLNSDLTAKHSQETAG